MVRRRLSALLLVTLLASGCSALEESLACPGQDCPPELRAVADDAAAVDGVTEVDLAWRYYNLDHGTSGGLDVHASVSGRRAASVLAGRLADLYDASKVEPVDRLRVTVVPEPEVSRRDDQESTAGGKLSSGAQVGCEDTRCSDQLAAFETAFADASVAGEATLGDVAWTPAAPDDVLSTATTSVELTSTAGLLDAAQLQSLTGSVLDVARDAGLFAVGDVSLLIHYQRRVEFSFDFEPKQ